MDAFTDVSKHVAQQLRKGELQHVQHVLASVKLEPLLVLRDDTITEYNINDLLHGDKFGIDEDWYLQEVSGLDIENLERGVGDNRKEETRSESGRKVTWSAKFEKLTWKKLRNTQSLTEHLTNGKLDIKHTLVESTYYERSFLNRCLGRFPVLKVVDSILYTNSDTVVSITTEPLLDISVKEKKVDDKKVEDSASYPTYERKTVKTTLPANTVMAYGCVNLLVDMSNGKMKVDDKGGFCGTPAPENTNCASGKLTVDDEGGFCGTPAPKDTNCASVGRSQPSASGDISLTVSIGTFLLVVNYNNIDRVIELLSKHVAQIMRKREPQHVQHQLSIEELEPIVKDEERLEKEAELNRENARLRQVNEDLQKLNADKDKKIQERDRMIADKDKTVDKKVETDRFDMAIGSDERKNRRIQDYVFNSRNSRNPRHSHNSRISDV